MDRLLKDLKERLAPEAEGLYRVIPLDKACTGILLFAT